MKRKSILLSIAAAMAMLTTSVVAPAGALATDVAPAPAACVAADNENPSEAVGQMLRGLGSAPSDAQVEAATGLVRVNGSGQRIPAEEHESVLRRASKVTSGPEDVVVFQPRFYTSFCGGITRNYVVADVSFQHRRTDGLVCRSCLSGPFNVGGYDTFGLAFSDKVYDKGSAFNSCDYETQDRFFSCGSPTFKYANGSFGVAYGFQDKAWLATGGAWGTNFDNGRIVYHYDRYPDTPTCIQAFSRYGHTWSSTGINGVGVGPWSISIQWSKSENVWQKASSGGDACP